MAMLPNQLPKLAQDPAGRSLGLNLPPGTLVDATSDGRWHEPLLWHAEGPAEPGSWERLLPARMSAGLHPVLLSMDEALPATRDLDPGAMSYPGDHDADEVLAGLWGDEEESEEDDADLTAPFGRAWPGLAPEREFEADPDVRAAEVAASVVGAGWIKDPRAALVPARRSADVPAAIGWTGPCNHENDVARLCAVLRSWEERFGVRVVAVAFDVLVLSVAAPPATEAEAEAVAAEHFAFCPDNVTQGSGSLRAYAESLVDAHAWSFWWD
ncbi:DUF4253 domain-containing protein [Actinacidiphila glaucinigra]|uniref:DUF4253 domain-containing protein n=1 Tax=Actinacidiphila glaucinigra TaxID=235986 RepID=UPI002DD9E142|nr:DUF4253 domain-containing protein [Actinacidiphila glaucinigra]WSD60767.1 DUF4253 domain-containing protein [Actinacidiphila glaucinigra]